MISRLTLQVVVPAVTDRASPEVRPLIDGRDLLADAFTAGPGEDPAHILRRGTPLLPTDEPHEVRLAEADCTEGCCGALYVTIRSEADSVVWSNWRNPGARTVELPELRFDASQYRLEIDRAVSDLRWEWPARTVARLLEQELRNRSEWLEQWDCELTAVTAWSWERDRIRVLYLHPAHGARTEGQAWLQFQQQLTISSADPTAQAEELVRQVTATDPRTADVCGGSAEYAERLGYPWPG